MKIYTKNKKIHLENEILKEYEAGVVLLSDEVKSIRKSIPSLGSAYCMVINWELFLKGISLSHAKNPDSLRKLLLHKNEIIRINTLLKENKSSTVLPIEMYEKKGRIKFKIAVCRGLNQFDKRQKIKEKEMRKLGDFD